jgi:hypothetical protein
MQMYLAEITRLLAAALAHIVAFWAGVAIINLGIGLGAKNVPAPYTLTLEDFKKSRRNRDQVAFWLGFAGVVICLLAAGSLFHFFWRS